MNAMTLSARRIWLAGLGAWVRAHQEAREDLFEDLIRRGQRLEAQEGEEGDSLAEAAAPLADLAESWQLLASLGPLLEALAAQKLRRKALIEAMLPAEPPSAAAVLQARRNAAAREALLQEFGAVSSAEVAQLAGSRAKNKAALANRWKQEGRLFSVTDRGAVGFPAFQFDAEGRPRPAIAEVIRALAGKSSEWELALWFLGSCGWLGGRRPVDLLESDPEAVAQAARSEAADLVY
jgi:hypothetical protein